MSKPQPPGAHRTRIYRAIMVLLVVVSIIPLAVLIRRMNRPARKGPQASNQAINARNLAYADSNSFCFTDRDRAFHKPKGVFRIAVLGDSFIWGDGIPYEQIWSHILERRLLDEYDSIEVMSWGRDGWSTQHEYRFFKRYGKEFGIDLLIIGWVDNDPDVGRTKQVPDISPEVGYPHLYRIWPWLARVVSHLGQVNGYVKWRDEIYRPDNLREYQKVLNEFRRYLADQHIPVVCVMTPGPFEPGMKERFDTVEPMIRAAGFPCIDLYGPMRTKLDQYSGEELRANPENSHPGEVMTEEMSNEVYDYLQQNNYLVTVPQKRK